MVQKSRRAWGCHKSSGSELFIMFVQFLSWLNLWSLPLFLFDLLLLLCLSRLISLKLKMTIRRDWKRKNLQEKNLKRYALFFFFFFAFSMSDATIYLLPILVVVCWFSLLFVFIIIPSFFKNFASVLIFSTASILSKELGNFNRVTMNFGLLFCLLIVFLPLWHWFVENLGPLDLF